MTVRLDARTRMRLKNVAKRRRLTPSGVTRLALETWLDAEESTASASPYAQIRDLVGVLRGGDERRSSRTTRALAASLEKRWGGSR
jgi:hypothetical protein